MLALATSLSEYPLTDDLSPRAQERSRTCGSTVDIGLALDAGGLIARLGMRVSACAVGQASAALFAQSAKGRAPYEISQAFEQIESWLKAEGAPPDWPGFAVLESARPYSSRHEALLLSWKAACAALSKAEPSS
ncbi:MAG: hypothetical protein A3J40_02500 [Erythrobacter sp. RIFCSPHIGHO2_12_FULL_63_10]|nr:MAG: hypothetical protein A3J40_02500 [Erythrobacter sp. RIFCSPHIGHO2_12_FULL_63_10]